MSAENPYPYLLYSRLEQTADGIAGVLPALQMVCLTSSLLSKDDPYLSKCKSLWEAMELERVVLMWNQLQNNLENQ